MGSGQIPLKSQLFYAIEAGESLGIRLRLLLVLLLLIVFFPAEETSEEAALFRLGLLLLGVLGALDVGSSGLLRLAGRQNGRPAAWRQRLLRRSPQSKDLLEEVALVGGWLQVFVGAVPSRKAA